MPENAPSDDPRPVSYDHDSTTLTTAKSGWVWLVLVALVGVLAAWDCAHRGYWGLALCVIVWAVAICWLLTLIFVLPKLSIGTDGVTCRNVLVRVFIPWRKLSDVRQTLFVELVPTSGEAVKVWAAPVSAFQRARQRSRDRVADASAGGGRSGGPSQPGLVRGLIEERDKRLEGTNGRGMGGEIVKTALKRDWLVCIGLFVLALVSLVLV